MDWDSPLVNLCRGDGRKRYRERCKELCDGKGKWGVKLRGRYVFCSVPSVSRITCVLN